MDYKDACSKIASICREQADTDVTRREFWIRQADEWSARAREEKADAAATHEVHQGRMVAKPAKDERKP